MVIYIYVHRKRHERAQRTFDGEVWILELDGPPLVLGAIGGAGEPAFSRS
jgi:hypothetical protein